jgi:hypothetical protein
VEDFLSLDNIKGEACGAGLRREEGMKWSKKRKRTERERN